MPEQKTDVISAVLFHFRCLVLSSGYNSSESAQGAVSMWNHDVNLGDLVAVLKTQVVRIVAENQSD